jgi:excisionase family DNA binding protein
MSGPRLAATEPGEAAMAPSPRIFRLSRYPTRTAPPAPGRLWSRAQPPAAPSGLLIRRDGPVTHPPGNNSVAGHAATPRQDTAGSPWARNGTLQPQPAYPPPYTTAHPRKRSKHMARPGDRLTIAQLCEELGISRSTFYEWRAKGRAPRCIKLPNGQIRIRRAEFERWLESLEEVA